MKKFIQKCQLLKENHLILKAYQRGIKQFFEQEKALVEAGNKLTILDLEKELLSHLIRV